MLRPVNERQLEVLKWIADGCPEGRWEPGDYTYKTTSVALNGRRLVKVKGRGRRWKAQITEAGRYFLEHGTYPPDHFGM